MFFCGLELLGWLLLFLYKLGWHGTLSCFKCNDIANGYQLHDHHDLLTRKRKKKLSTERLIAHLVLRKIKQVRRKKNKIEYALSRILTYDTKGLTKGLCSKGIGAIFISLFSANK